MTITHKSWIIYQETEISAKGSGLGALLGGPRTSNLVLKPNDSNSYDDAVEIHASHGSYEVKGTEINSNTACIQNEVRWYYSGGKERM